jgi:hypothetical protein
MRDCFADVCDDGCRHRTSLVFCAFQWAGAVLALHSSPFAQHGRILSGFDGNQMGMTACWRDVGDAKKRQSIQQVFFTLSGKH